MNGPPISRRAALGSLATTTVIGAAACASDDTGGAGVYDVWLPGPQGADGVLMPWGDPARGMLNESFFPYLWQAEGEIFTEDGTRTAFHSEAGIEAVEFMTDLMETGGMPGIVSGINGGESKVAFLDGRCAFVP